MWQNYEKMQEIVKHMIQGSDYLSLGGMEGYRVREGYSGGWSWW